LSRHGNELYWTLTRVKVTQYNDKYIKIKQL
jgi:hypothetical protein